MELYILMFQPMFNTTERAVRASLFFNRANMHLALALCMYFVMTSPSPFSSQLLGEICSNKIALAAWIRLNPTERTVRASLFFNRVNMHLALALCMYFVITSPSPFSSQLLREICSNEIALAACIRLNPIPNGN